MMKAWLDKTSGAMLGIFDADAGTPVGVDEETFDIIDLPSEMTDGLHEWDAATRAPVRHLPTAKLVAMQTVNTIRDNLQTGVIQTPSGAVDADVDSQRKINGLVTMAILGGDAFSVDFTLADDSDVTLSAPEMISLGVAVGQYIAAVHAYARGLKSQIASASTLAEFDAIELGTGWPS
jgi:hypothetical protein